MAANQGEIDDLTRLVEEGEDHEVLSFIKLLHPADIADLIEALDDRSRRRLLELMDPQTAGEVFSEIEDPYQEDLIKRLRTDQLSEIVSEMESDDAADLLGDLPLHEARAVMSRLDAEDVAEIGELLRYPEDSAGGIMQAELVDLHMSRTVSEAIEEIRAQADEVRQLRNLYVVDEGMKLKGIVSLRDIILADPEARLETVMN